MSQLNSDVGSLKRGILSQRAIQHSAHIFLTKVMWHLLARVCIVTKTLSVPLYITPIFIVCVWQNRGIVRSNSIGEAAAMPRDICIPLGILNSTSFIEAVGSISGPWKIRVQHLKGIIYYSNGSRCCPMKIDPSTIQLGVSHFGRTCKINSVDQTKQGSIVITPFKHYYNLRLQQGSISQCRLSLSPFQCGRPFLLVRGILPSHRG